MLYRPDLSHRWRSVCGKRLRREVELRRSRHMAHSSFLVWNGTSQPLLCLSELFCTITESPKELTNIGILGKPNKST